MPGFTYETLCPNCGKPIRPELLAENKDRKFCNRQCWSEYNEKKAAEKQRKKMLIRQQHYLTRPKTPEEQCKKCRYGSYIGGMWCCNYFEVAKHSRHSIHPEGLPDECQEFQRRKRGRKPKQITIR